MLNQDIRCCSEKVSYFTLKLSVTVMSKLEAALLSSCCAVKPSPEYMMTCSVAYNMLHGILPRFSVIYAAKVCFLDLSLYTMI